METDTEKTIKRGKGRPKGSKSKKTLAKEYIKELENTCPHYDFKLLPKQKEFLQATQREVLFSGGLGNGKTSILAIKCVIEASKPGNVVLLVRKHLTTLRKSTLRTLLEPEGNKPPILPLGTYTHNKVERIIQLNNGGTIIYTGCDDELSIRSVNVGSVFIDEACELEEKEYLELLMRLRIDIGSLALNACTNPSHKNHFLYRRFVTDANPNRKIIYGSSLENIYLPKSNIESLSELKGDTYKKLVEGQWSTQDKIIYSNFNINNNTKDIQWNKDMFQQYFIGVDYGFTNPTAILFAGVDGDGNLFILEEWEETKKYLKDILGHISKYIEYNPTIIIDPSAAALIAECQALGWNAIKANNAVELGIDRVRSRFEQKTLTINSNCNKLITEIENYTLGEDNKPVKINDHEADCARYICSHLSDLYADNATKNDKFFIF